MGNENGDSSEPVRALEVAVEATIAKSYVAAPEELGQLLEQFRPYLLMVANQEVPSALEPKYAPSDLVQETILKGYERYGTFQGSSTNELARWLRQILLNHLANVRKAYGREKRDISREQLAGSSVVQPGTDSPSAQALSLEEHERLSVALARLSEVHRQVILLRHRDNLTFVEIGHRLERTDEAVRKLWARGIRLLKQELGIDESA